MSLGRVNTRTAAFATWFGRSKVVDARGEPLVVYHGTTSEEDFAVFNVSEDIGYHFASTPEGANARLLDVAGFNRRQGHGRPQRSAADVWKTHATAAAQKLLELEEGGARIIPAYLRIEKPLRVHDGLMWTPSTVLSFLTEAGVLTEAQAERYANSFVGVDNDFVYRHMRRAGYDGIVYDNATEGGGEAWIALRPEQIKSPWARRFNLRSKDFLDGLGDEVELRTAEQLDRGDGTRTVDIQAHAAGEWLGYAKFHYGTSAQMARYLRVVSPHGAQLVAARRPPLVAWLANVMVFERRGDGVGRRLLDAVDEAMAKRGVRVALLHAVSDTEQGGAQERLEKAYVRRGYHKIIEEEHGPLFGRGIG